MAEIVIKIPDGYDLSKIENGSIASGIILKAVKTANFFQRGTKG